MFAIPVAETHMYWPYLHWRRASAIYRKNSGLTGEFKVIQSELSVGILEPDRKDEQL